MASRPTKYAHVVKNLPKYLGDDPGRLDLLNKLRDEIRQTPVDEEQDWNPSAQIHNRAVNYLSPIVSDLLTLVKKCPHADTASGLVRAYADARFVKEVIGEWASSIQLLVDAYEGMMIDQMEAEDVASLRLASGGSVGTSKEPYGKVVDKEAFRLWCIKNGYESQLQLWPGTMNAIAKERTLAGVPPPDGVEVSVKTVVRLNKA